jgi:hypothetical protein|tara:strand:- start:586 stop:795 length:210 start_codon:yes stop_codon:yes gene_type:complete
MNYKSYRPRSNRTRIYEPELASTKFNAVVAVVAFALFGAAAWHSITTTLDQQQAQHCAQGWQPACEKLK